MDTKRSLAIVFCVLGVFFLAGCGPKSVGDDISVSSSSSLSAAYDSAQARYPQGGAHGGRSVDKALYFLNTPAYMQARQRQLENFLRQSYTKDAPNDYTNLQPRQVSPFRE